MYVSCFALLCYVLVSLVFVGSVSQRTLLFYFIFDKTDVSFVVVLVVMLFASIM